MKLLKYQKKLTKAAINTILNKHSCDIQKYGIKIAEALSTSESNSSDLKYLNQVDTSNEIMRNKSPVEECIEHVAEENFQENTNFFRTSAAADYAINNWTDYNVELPCSINFTEYQNAQMNADRDSSIDSQCFNDVINENSFNMDMLIPEISMVVDSPKFWTTPCSGVSEIARQVANNISVIGTPHTAMNDFTSLHLNSPVRREKECFNRLVMYDSSSQSSYASFTSNKKSEIGNSIMKVQNSAPKMFNFKPNKQREDRNNSSSINEIKFTRPLHASAAKMSAPLITSTPKNQFKSNFSCFSDENTSKQKPFNNHAKTETIHRTISDPEISCIIEELETCDEFFSDWDTSEVLQPQEDMDKSKKSNEKTTSKDSSSNLLEWQQKEATSNVEEKQCTGDKVKELPQHIVSSDENKQNRSSISTTGSHCSNNVSKQTSFEKGNSSLSKNVSIQGETKSVTTDSFTAMVQDSLGSNSISYSPLYSSFHTNRNESSELSTKQVSDFVTKSNSQEEDGNKETETLNSENKIEICDTNVVDKSEVQNIEKQPVQVSSKISEECNELFSLTNGTLNAQYSCTSKSLDSSHALKNMNSTSESFHSLKNMDNTLESSNNTKNSQQCKRKKFKPPFVFENKKAKSPSNDNSCSTTSSKVFKRQCITKLTVPRFKPPKVTKRQIQNEFDEQDRRMMETLNSTNASDYLQLLLNRPSVRQIQESEHIALIRKTKDGVIVIPAETKKRIPKKQLGLPTIEKNLINVSIFSDRYADKFEEFMQSKEMSCFIKKSKSFSFGDDFAPKSQLKRCEEFASDVLIKRMKKETPAGHSRNVKGLQPLDNRELFSQSNMSQDSVSRYLSLTPDGYYKDNKAQINSIVDKYLNAPKEGAVETKASKFKILKSWNSSDSLFSKS